MSRPMLPGQNSKYWGYDLNNYLLSLENKINELANFHNVQQTLVSRMGPGFQTGTWNYTKDTSSTIVWSNCTLTGECSYESYENGEIVYNSYVFDETKIFNNIYSTSYEEGKLNYPSLVSGGVDAIDAKNNFYAVYLFFEKDSTTNKPIYKTVFCDNYIYRGDCIMIGSYECSSKTFTPRVQTSSKGIFQSYQDIVKSFATVKLTTAGTVEKWPTTSLKIDSNNFFAEYWFNTNGVSPEHTLEGYTEVASKAVSGTGYDTKYSKSFGNTYLVEEVSDGLKTTLVNSDSLTLRNNVMACYYLAPSGNIYIQTHAAPTNLPTAKDYMLESSDPLPGKDGFTTSALVFIGVCYKNTSSSYQWISAKQNGVSPVIMDVDNGNPHKILIENNQYWTGSNAYKIKLNKISNDHVAVHLTDYVKNPSNFIDAKIDFITPEFRIFNGNSIEGEIILNCFKDASNNQLGQLILTGDETSGIILQGGDAYSKITLRHLDEDKIIINSKSDGGTIILSDDPAFNACTLSGDGETFTITCGQAQGGEFKIFEDQSMDFQVSVEGEFKVKGNTTLTNGHVDIGTSINSNNFNVYNKSTFYGPVTIWTHSSSPFTVNSDTILTKGFKTDSSGTYYFNSQGDILCNNIAFTSDIRLKTNLKPINSKVCHNAVQNLNVNTYTYIRNNYDTLGLIAQEIEEQLPEYAHLLVHENEDGEKMVSEHKLLFILWEALKQEIKERKGGK